MANFYDQRATTLIRAVKVSGNTVSFNDNLGPRQGSINASGLAHRPAEIKENALYLARWEGNGGPGSHILSIADIGCQSGETLTTLKMWRLMVTSDEPSDVELWQKLFWSQLEPSCPFEAAQAKAQAEYDRFLSQLSDMGIGVTQAGGNCPVQVFGQLESGEYIYFRARGEHWSVTIAEDEDLEKELFYTFEYWGDGPYAAGYMPYGVVVEKIRRALGLWWQKQEHDEAQRQLPTALLATYDSQAKEAESN